METDVSQIKSERAYAAACQLDEDRLIIHGGALGEEILDDAWIYNSKDNKFTKVDTKLPKLHSPLQFHQDIT